MHIESQSIPGLYTVDIERFVDERGYFARTRCVEEFARAGIDSTFVQSSVSYNTRKGTLRGMHLQLAPHGETKLLRCVAGAVYDVLLDLRVDSPTEGKWLAFELSAENQRAVVVPPGVAHGFQTLADSSIVVYDIDTPYAPGSAAGVRWDDPVFGIVWPQSEERIISDKDRSWPDYDPSRGLTGAG